MMHRQFPSPIREDTVAGCWEYMDGKRRKFRIRSLTAQLGGFFSNLTFLFSLLWGINGLILQYFPGSYSQFLQGISFFLNSWKKVSMQCLTGNSIGSDFLRLLLLSYLAAIAVFLIVFLLVTLLYHPRKRAVPKDSYPEAARKLAALTREVWGQMFRTHISSSVVSILLVIIAAFALFFSYAFFLQDADTINALLSQFPTGNAATNALLYVFFAYFILHFLCLPVVFIARPLYYSRISYGFVAEAATAALFAGEPADGMTAEALRQRHLENAITVRQEGIRTEYQHGYKIAMDLYLKAALGGDIPAMEHYARHCLLAHQNEPARYWLDQAAASGEISPEGKNMRQRLKMGRNLNVGYLQEGVDSSLKATRRRSAFQLLKNILSLVFFLGVSAAVLAGAIRYFSGEEASAAANFRNLFSSMYENSSEDAAAGQTEKTIADNIPLQILTESGTPWEGACIAYDGYGAPLVFRYLQETGGDLTVPYCFPEGEQFHSAQVYFGNKWDIRGITKHVSYDSTAQTIVITEKYLQGLTPGEYFIILNDGDHYFPLLVSEKAAENP